MTSYVKIRWHSLLFTFVVATSIGLVAAERAESTAAEVRIGPTEATISNGLLRLKIPLVANGAGPMIVEDLRTGATLALKGEPFVLEFEGGESVRSQDMQLIESTADNDPLGGKLRLEYRRDDLRVQLVTELRSGQTWVTRWLDIRKEQPPDAERRRLVAVSLAKWRHEQAVGSSGPGQTIPSLGYPSGCGQVVYQGVSSAPLPIRVPRTSPLTA